MSEGFDCQTCGACCASPARDCEEIPSLRPHDMTRMSKRTVRLYVHHDSAIHTSWKRQRGGPLAGCRVCVCSAMAGSLMNRVRCLIYEERPDVCREFAPGGPACLAARAEVVEATAAA